MIREYAVGIDLHGTLLDDRWQIPERLVEELTTALRSIKDRCELFLCTGNDLTFVHGHIAHHFSTLFDGFVLETGCVVSDGSVEDVLVPPQALSALRELEERLREKPPAGIQFFAPRLATISMFTKTERGGPDPTHLYPRVMEKVEELGYGEEVLVTHSDVAVDIIPAGFNKFTGLRHAAEAPSLMGIADSLNDLHLITDAHRAFLPANASPALMAALRDRGRDVKPLETVSQAREGTIARDGTIAGDGTIARDGTIAISQSRHTEGVIEILHFLRHHLQ